MMHVVSKPESKSVSEHHKGITLSDQTVNIHGNASHIEKQCTILNKCNLCEFEAFNSEIMKTHMPNHHTAREIKCDLCDEYFSEQQIMKAHKLKDHTSYKPCKYFESNSCRFGDSCKFSHKT